MKFRYRWALLILYAISPILVHGTELGRPDHQSLSILLVIIALCAEWALRNEASQSWSILSGIAWGLAIWVSAYEPLILLFLLLLLGLLQDRHLLFAKHRRIGWIWFAAIITIALSMERRIPSLAILHSTPIFRNWSRTIGELLPVSPFDPVWFRWAGYMILIAPILIWIGYCKNILPPTFHHPSSHRDLWVHGLAGALGLFLLVDLCHRASEFTRVDQVTPRRLDRGHVVDLSDFARLGRKALA